MPDLPTPAEDIAARLSRVLRSEAVGFQTYSLMRAIALNGGLMSKARLSLVTGTSYQIVSHQMRRTPWFEPAESGPLVAVALNPDGTAKLERIQSKLENGY